MATNNNQILDQQAKYYATYAKIKDNPRYRKAKKYIDEHLEKGQKVLDIGCTNGDFSEELVQKGYDCYGLEFMDEAIVESTAKGIKVSKGSFLEPFPFEDQSFDCIFAGEVIEHTIDDVGFLKEANRVLKPGGVLILTTPNLVSLGNRFLMVLGFMPRFAYHEFHYRYYNPALIRQKVTDSGFKIDKLDSSYIGISTAFSSVIGPIGEQLGSVIPSWGEHHIIFAIKK